MTALPIGRNDIQEPSGPPTLKRFRRRRIGRTAVRLNPLLPIPVVCSFTALLNAGPCYTSRRG